MFDNTDMAETRTNPPIYEELMKLKPEGLSPNGWATRAGMSRAIWADMRRHGNPTRPTLERLLSVVGMTLADFEARIAPVRTEVAATGMSAEQVADAWAMTRARPVPVVGSAFGSDGDWADGIETTELMLSEVLDYVGRPPGLANDQEAYAVRIVGESMAPRYEPGELVYVSPRSPVAAGDDVIVQLHDPSDMCEGSQVAGRITTVLIKRLVRRSAQLLTLRQFNPEMTFDVPAARVRRIHRVRGRL